MHRLLTICICLVVMAAGCAKKELTENEVQKITPTTLTNIPEEVQIITSDVELFWKMYDHERPLFTALELNEQYIDSGTTALSLFYEEKIERPETYLDLLNSWIDRGYYENVREQTLRFDTRQDEIISAFKRFGKLYPQAVFTDVHIVIGALNTGGVVLPSGHIVLAAEMFANNEDTDIGYLSPWLQSVLRGPDYLSAVALHELVHLQQQRFARENNLPVGGLTLLDRSLLEGGADFITQIVLKKFLNDQLFPYAEAREEKLWHKFKKRMNRRNLNGWLYNGSTATEEPADLGYYIGFKIAEAYYQAASDKQQAVRDIIEMKDGEEFLKESGYPKSFK